MAQLLQRGRHDVIRVMDEARSTTLATITILGLCGMQAVIQIVEAGEQSFEEVISVHTRQIELACGSIALGLIALADGTAHIEAWATDGMRFQ